MKLPRHIYDELKTVAPALAEQEKTNVFSVPPNYFSSLTKQIIDRIYNDNDESITLPISETHFSNVPAGYFDTLADNILMKIKSMEEDDANEEIKKLSPMLYAVQNENIFSVPRGYFETLPDVILNKIQSPPKVVAMKKRSTFWNYAAAAMLAGVMAISALLIKNNSVQQIPIETGKNIPSYVKEASIYKNAKQINEGIAKLDDDDIIGYLEKTSSNDDEDALLTSIQEKDLPSEQDYLYDENTLNIYLNKTDGKRKEKEN